MALKHEEQSQPLDATELEEVMEAVRLGWGFPKGIGDVDSASRGPSCRTHSCDGTSH